MSSKVAVTIAIVCTFLIAAGGLGELFISKAEYIPQWPKYLSGAGLFSFAFLISSAGGLWGDKKISRKRRFLIVMPACFFIIFYIGGSYYKYSQYSEFIREIKSQSREVNPHDCRRALSSKKFTYYLTGKALDYKTCDGVSVAFRPSADDVAAREAVQSVINGEKVERNLLAAWLGLFAIVSALWLRVAVQRGINSRADC